MKKGSITLFLSLMLMLLISFLCTALQSARMAGSRYLFTLASEAAVRSVFAAYDTRVWEEYRILMLTDKRLAEQIGTECAENYTDNMTLFPLSVSSVMLTEQHTLAENGAAGWEDAAVSYMETRLPLELISSLLEQSGLAEKLKDLTKGFTAFRDLFEPIVKVEQSLCGLEEKLSKAVTAYEQGRELATELRACGETVSHLAEAGAGEDVIKEAWTTLKTCLEQVRKHTEGEKAEITSLITEAAEKLREAESLRQQINTIVNDLGGGASSELAAVSDLGGYLNGLVGRFGFLQNLPEELKKQMDVLSRYADIELPSLEAVVSGEGREALNLLQDLAGSLAQEIWEPDHMEMFEGSEEDRKNVNSLLSLKERLNQGILGLVLEDSSQISQAVLSRYLLRTERESTDSLADQAYQNLLYGEYALRYTACYGEDGKEGLKYETEYLIGGKADDPGNLTEVVVRLLLLRGTANLAFLLQDEASQTQIRPVAAGVSAALGGWIPEALMSVMIMVLWALAEAVCDVRALLSQGHVPFWKDSSSWQISFDSLFDLFDDEFVAGADRKEGMLYEDYLRILLFLVSVEEKCFRTMEVAEENMQVFHWGFQIDQAIDRAVVVVKGQAAGQECQESLEYGY